MIISKFLSDIAIIVGREDLPMYIRAQAVMLICVMSCNPSHRSLLTKATEPLLKLARITFDLVGIDEGEESVDEKCDNEDHKMATSATVALAIAISNLCHQEQYQQVLRPPDVTKLVLRSFFSFPLLGFAFVHRNFIATTAQHNTTVETESFENVV
jgi:hypothetical protein